MTDQEQEPWQEPWPEKMYLLHPSIKTFGAMVSNPERREYIRADRIEELEKEQARLHAGWHEANVSELIAKLKLTKAVEALREIITRWDTPHWKDVEATGSVINRARAALAELEKE